MTNNLFLDMYINIYITSLILFWGWVTIGR